MSYFFEYNIPIKIARLTQTFGPGVNYYDGRVFAEFARCVIEKKDIILKTKGLTERDYLYIGDAVSALLTILLCGENGQAYNVANEDTFCSIFDMASMLANAHGIGVKMELQNSSITGYANELHMDLNTKKLRELGWKPTTDLLTTYERMIETMRK